MRALARIRFRLPTIPARGWGTQLVVRKNRADAPKCKSIKRKPASEGVEYGEVAGVTGKPETFDYCLNSVPDIHDEEGYIRRRGCWTDMQEIVAAVAALAGILVGYWIRNLSVNREKQQFENRLAELAHNLGEMKAELVQAQSLASARAGFESLAAEREKTAARIAAERDSVRD